MSRRSALLFFLTLCFSESLFRNFWFIANFSDWLSTFFFQFFVNFFQLFVKFFPIFCKIFCTFWSPIGCGFSSLNPCSGISGLLPTFSDWLLVCFLPIFCEIYLLSFFSPEALLRSLNPKPKIPKPLLITLQILCGLIPCNFVRSLWFIANSWSIFDGSFPRFARPVLSNSRLL